MNSGGRDTGRPSSLRNTVLGSGSATAAWKLQLTLGRDGGDHVPDEAAVRSSMSATRLGAKIGSRSLR